MIVKGTSRWAARILLFAGFVASAQASTLLFQDGFTTQGTKLDLARWTTEIGPGSFLGRTQLADWVSPGSSGQFVVGADGAELTLNTFNPTGLSLYGTHGKTLDSFQPAGNLAIDFTSRLKLTFLQPGLVYGMYLYGCPGPCATQHDEIDIELLTNSLQGGPMKVQLNRYASEPLGVGNGGLVDLPPGFDPLAFHDWTIRWSLSQIDYLVDGYLLGSSTDHIPQGPMQVNEIAWGPGSEWPAAYSASLQPTGVAGQNQAFTALLTSVTVTQSEAPEPQSWMLVLCGLAAAGFWLRRRPTAPLGGNR